LGWGWALLKKVKGEKMGRRVPMLLAAIAVMVALFATAAYAAQIEGTDRDEILNESNRNDKIEGKDGDDDIRANLYGISATSPEGDRDRLSGGRHIDTLNAVDGDARDVLDGGKGYDKCYGDEITLPTTDPTTDPDTDQDKFVNCQEEYLNGVRVDTE
jgi:hypothetical protein